MSKPFGTFAAQVLKAKTSAAVWPDAPALPYLTRRENVWLRPTCGAATLDHKRFRSGQPFIAMPDFTQSIPIGLNPPEHAAYRRLLNKYFVPARMAELEPVVTSYVNEHLDELLEGGRGEFVTQFASPLPARVRCAFLHMPDSAWEDLVGHLKTLDSMRDDPQKVSEVVVGLFAGYVTELVVQRHRVPLDPEKDLISGIMAAEIDGRPLSDEERRSSARPARAADRPRAAAGTNHEHRARRGDHTAARSVPRWVRVAATAPPVSCARGGAAGLTSRLFTVRCRWRHADLWFGVRRRRRARRAPLGAG